MKLCRAVFILLVACALHSVTCLSEEDEAVGAVETAQGEGIEVLIHGKNISGKTINVERDVPNGGKGIGEEELKKAKEDVQKAKELADKCEEKKRETLMAAQIAQKNLKECTHNSGINLSQCRTQVSDREKHLYVCRENEDKCYEKIKDIGREYEQNVSRKEKEAAELRDKVLKLERTLEEMELKLKMESYGGAGRSNKEDKDSDYLISFPMVQSYFMKVLKIYKTFYIIGFEQTNMSRFLSQIVLHKDALVTHLKLYGKHTMEKLHEYKAFISECDWIIRLLSFYENSSLSAYVQLIKGKVANFAFMARRLFLQKVVYPVSRNLYPKMTQSMRNKYMNINWDHFLHKLHNNSEILVVKLNSINPELQGIISPRLEDQLILLIFFMAVNIIHLYLFFYFLFILIKLSKRVSMCLFMWSYFCLSVAYRCTIFVLTLPIRPCIRKRDKRSRKVYRRHDERTCANPERVSYLQQEIKKMHKGHKVHQRRG
ncbi:conserved Plasmodium protein, unknown function [Plasmodium knowlesi strain H]|uniref:Uncharacterized protein n=3 Tax=Plasmodium knowlesi TaxID=5850 RepID=A0A5K1VQR0_PLAKH|nr:conserved Plasmodium protein, unknown function [Plasmodium knowlesi strain H]OTN66938.1 Uncharacterized protein PKNOH_S07465900 [Plasmodium knowlesi]CAA9988783.1 conserved Plasmodium protein, unknown function [Plasmodium knowlesi strain H]SBO21739.1 conserved Plasmodium protein, unknown function [Plasmodium knowlesi strain H]SBO22132.1 conserved Plasmodium protein, unknown function [Plasmodium knowlesi strain H]VVS78257.1 conserved Plasmodium protein, unknown function [Plasmodium knowlesi s|eukprot:XP_002259760.1 hypothetical protein, conserved in Plasmodium species [Plasmodium knowlesi strain H]